MSYTRTSLFESRGKDLRIEYSDLSNVPEFKSLTKNEMDFVWAFACEASPYKNWASETKIFNCLKLIRDEVTATRLEEYAQMKFPDKIQSAIDAMSKFNLSVRVKAKEISDRLFKNIEKIAFTDISEIKDIEDKKRYVDLVTNVTKLLPIIVSQVENGFGVRYIVDEEPVEEKPISWEDLTKK